MPVCAPSASLPLRELLAADRSRQCEGREDSNRTGGVKTSFFASGRLGRLSLRERAPFRGAKGDARHPYSAPRSPPAGLAASFAVHTRAVPSRPPLTSCRPLGAKARAVTPSSCPL